MDGRHFEPGTTANGSIATSLSLDDWFDFAPNAEIANRDAPHVTVDATAHNGQEYYRLTVAAGMTVTFDVDHANKPGRSGPQLRQLPQSLRRRGHPPRL